jgi:two-component system KDP operon response regulator KdpE
MRVAIRRRRPPPTKAAVVCAGDVQIDLHRRLVTRGGLPVRLSAREYDILSRLAEVGGKVLTHQQLITSGWRQASIDNVQYLRIYIRRLRRKLESDPSSPRYLVTEGGVGYRFAPSSSEQF